MLLCKFLPFFVTFLKFTNGVSVLDLGGTWTVQNHNGSYSLEGTVPGGIYSDLMNNDIIEDVFYGYNDVNSRWVGYMNWTYSREVIIEESFYNNEVINLVFDGIDTFADIYVNDVLIGSTNNMFVQYIFDIKSSLKLDEENTITLKFLSPIEKAASLYEIQAKDYEVPPQCVPEVYQGECHVNHIRKMQASFSWDWGPAFPSVGLWKPVYLEAYNVSSIRDVIVNTAESDDSWVITTSIYMADPPGSIIKGTITIILHTDIEIMETVYTVEITASQNGDYVFTRSLTIPKLYVGLWWPNGYGNQNLYELELHFVDGANVIHKKSFKIGFRTVSLVQNELANGRSFYFTVNSVPIFAKGSNSIPISILPERDQDPEKIRFILQSAKDVHMNMVRVWGGGVYESDTFYELADEMGILIWQDFMFACSMYPTNEEFLSTVKEEVRHQVRRLQYHPSIILWAANNENEAALIQNWYGTSSNFDVYKQDFVTLYVDTIRVEVLARDASRPFVTSSPTNGVESEADGYISDNPQNEFYGDVHYYNYIANPLNSNYYPIPRFSSEYGLQSLPALSTWLTVTEDVSDLAYNSQFMQHRQHHPLGNSEMYALIQSELSLPNRYSDNFYKVFIYYSQIIQAMGMKLQTEYYRLWRSNINSIGQGLTMGALYWQLNDVWVAPTWSGIDFNNNWKMLHYFARNFYSPVIVTSHLSQDRNLDIYVVSDLMTNSYNNTVTLSVYKWESMDVYHKETFSISVLSGYSAIIHTLWIDVYLSGIYCGEFSDAKYNCFIHLSLTDEHNNKLAPDNFVIPSTIKTCKVPSASVTVDSIVQTDSEGKNFEINIKTNAIALFVWLESNNVRGIFSDNGFLQITEMETITFVAETVTTVDKLVNDISVTHLKDSQYFENI